jgi:hypothetical protein
MSPLTFHQVGQAKPVAARLHERAGRNEILQQALERSARFRRDLETLLELARRCWMFDLVSNELEQLIVVQRMCSLFFRAAAPIWTSPL